MHSHFFILFHTLKSDAERSQTLEFSHFPKLFFFGWWENFLTLCRTHSNSFIRIGTPDGIPAEGEPLSADFDDKTLNNELNA